MNVVKVATADGVREEEEEVKRTEFHLDEDNGKERSRRRKVAAAR